MPLLDLPHWEGFPPSRHPALLGDAGTPFSGGSSHSSFPLSVCWPLLCVPHSMERCPGNSSSCGPGSLHQGHTGLQGHLSALLLHSPHSSPLRGSLKPKRGIYNKVMGSESPLKPKASLEWGRKAVGSPGPPGPALPSHPLCAPCRRPSLRLAPSPRPGVGRAHARPAELTTASHTSLSLNSWVRVLGKESDWPV